ncbi:TonB-dependent receptor P39 [Chitinophaga sp. MM2321]
MKVKLIMVLLLALLMDVNAMAQKVTIHAKNATITAVFDEITRQTGYVFFYNDELMKKQGNITMDVRNEALDVVLKKHFPDRHLNFLVSDKSIAVKVEQPRADTVRNNVRTVLMQGKVMDATTGQPLIGVSIFVKGQKGGSVSNDKGVFSIFAEKGATLIFSILGYDQVVVEISPVNDYVVRMKPAVARLDEVVITTGIYTRRKDSYTGSVVTISNQELKKAGNGNVFQSLRNIAPAMFIDNFQLGSSPNALPNMQLRGTSTMGDLSGAAASLKGNYIKSPNEPLFILDGFEATLERIFDLDMNRIESVTILKDAASKAIYGSRAANGVIVLETKKTTLGKALVSYNASIDIELPDLSSYNLTNALEKLEAERIDGMYIAGTATENIQLQRLYESRRKLAMEGLNTDWIAKPLRNGVGQKHTIGVELGGNDLRLMADISYRDVQGAMIGSGRKNITANMNGSYRVKNFLFRNIMSINSNSTKESPYGKFEEYVKMNPYWRAENADGNIPYLSETGPNGEHYTNPMYNATINTNITTDYLNFIDNFYLEWTVLPGLKAVARAGVDVKSSGADEFYPASHTMFDSYSTDEMIKRKGLYRINNGKSTFLSGDFNMNYSKNVDRHTFFANVGFNASEKKYSEVMHSAEGFSSDKMDNILFARAYLLDSKPTGIDGLSREMGFLGAFSYMYDSRFMTDLTYRRSASSLFGSENKWGDFWSLGVGWNLHHEQFMQAFNWFDQFKIRASVGATGNPNFRMNAAVPTYAYFLESFYQGFPGSYLTNLANNTLQWETKLDYNVGADIRIKRLNLRFDYYQGFTENLVTNITMPTSTGFNTLVENLGKVKNEGVELNANYLLYQKGRDFVSVNFGIETNKNRIIRLSNAMKAYNDNMDKLAADRANGTPVKKYVDGMSMNAIWAVPSLGIDPATGNEIYLKKDGSTTYTWDPADMIVAGNSLPAYQGTFGVSAEYKRIGASFTGRYLGGGDLYNYTLVNRVENVDMNYNVDRRVLTGRWLYPGQVVQFKRLGNFDRPNENGSTTPEHEITRATTRFVQRREELQIGAVNVYYYLSEKTARRIGMQQFKVAVNMNELGTFSTIRLERGTDYPFSKTFSFSLSATL